VSKSRDMWGAEACSGARRHSGEGQDSRIQEVGFESVNETRTKRERSSGCSVGGEQLHQAKLRHRLGSATRSLGCGCAEARA
jgi:hypothetical protein